MGAFLSLWAKFSVGNFGNFPYQMKILFPEIFNLAMSLGDQKTYVMAQEDNKIEMEILANGTLIAIPTGWNSKSCPFVLPGKFPFHQRVLFALQPIPEF